MVQAIYDLWRYQQDLTRRTLSTVPEIIDPFFAKTSQNARFLLSENERFGLVFVKTGSINSGTVLVHCFLRVKSNCFGELAL
jgi:hypothetical protein